MYGTTRFLSVRFRLVPSLAWLAETRLLKRASVSVRFFIAKRSQKAIPIRSRRILARQGRLTEIGQLHPVCQRATLLNFLRIGFDHCAESTVGAKCLRPMRRQFGLQPAHELPAILRAALVARNGNSGFATMPDLDANSESNGPQPQETEVSESMLLDDCHHSRLFEHPSSSRFLLLAIFARKHHVLIN